MGLYYSRVFDGYDEGVLFLIYTSRVSIILIIVLERSIDTVFLACVASMSSIHQVKLVEIPDRKYTTKDRKLSSSSLNLHVQSLLVVTVLSHSCQHHIYRRHNACPAVLNDSVNRSTAICSCKLPASAFPSFSNVITPILLSHLTRLKPFEMLSLER
ncbi:hypothetical protein K474DRAFT_1670152 [Panus rudis PR-1116 ss-1]|nr:hypothetical protein K474DRAFT_1670152 [Panus rudis PR-1116 ss-1]